VLKWAGENECHLNAKTFISVATAGWIDILEWLFENKCPTNVDALYRAANQDKFEVGKREWM